VSNQSALLSVAQTPCQYSIEQRTARTYKLKIAQTKIIYPMNILLPWRLDNSKEMRDTTTINEMRNHSQIEP
jgi:hypothetical protein